MTHGYETCLAATRGPVEQVAATVRLAFCVIHLLYGFRIVEVPCICDELIHQITVEKDAAFASGITCA